MSDYVGPGWEKFTLLTKPEQSGKTFLMLQQIVKDFSDEPRNDGKININFIICDNNLLLVLQTGDRVENELNIFKDQDTDEMYVEFSSKSDRATRADSIFRLLTGPENIRNIICCSNGIRIPQIYDIITDINDSHAIQDMFHFNIWYDEADKSLSLISDNFFPLCNDYENISVYLITATAEKIIRKFKEIKIWAIENPTSKQYHGWLDNDIREMDTTRFHNNEDLINNVLTNYPSYIVPRTKWFIPASFRKVSHNNVKDICSRFGFATMIINGEGIAIYLPNGEVVKEEKDDMTETLIPELYNKHKLYQYPFAITGNMCISRGISISSSNFMLTHSIMPVECKNKSEASQIAGRMKGNQKGWENYKKPTVWCTEQFHNIATKSEEKTISVGKMAFEENWETITLDKFKTVEKYYYDYEHTDDFDSYKEALIYLKTQERHLKKKGDSRTIINVQKMDNRRTIHPDAEKRYYMTTKLVKEKDIKSNPTISDERITRYKLSQMALGTNLSEPNKSTASYVIYPVYEDIESPPESVRYVVRHTKRRDL